MIYTQSKLIGSVPYARNALVVQGNESAQMLRDELKDRKLTPAEKICIMYVPQERYTDPISEAPVEDMLGGWADVIHTRWVNTLKNLDVEGIDVAFVAFDIEGPGSAQFWVWGEQKIIAAYEAGIAGLPDINWEIFKEGTNAQKKPVIAEWQRWAVDLLKQRLMEYMVKPVWDTWGMDVQVSNYQWSLEERVDKNGHEIPPIALTDINSPVVYGLELKQPTEIETHPWVRPFVYARSRKPDSLIHADKDTINATFIPEPVF